MIKVVCFKWEHRGGYKLPTSIGRYTADHVNRLQKAVARHTTVEHEFICITDDPKGIECRTIKLWDKCMDKGGCFNRLYVFSKDMRELIGERFICIDLDVAITGSLDNLLSREEDFVINQFYGYGVAKRDQFYNGALIMMNAGARDQVWTEFIKDIDGNVELITQKREARMLVGTDQAWISHVLGRGEAMFTDEDDGVMAYRLLPNSETGKRLTPGSCMVFFAGAKDPQTEYSKNDWIREYWDGEVKHNDIKEKRKLVELIAKDIERGYKDCGYAMDIFNPRSMSEKLIHKKLFTRDERIIELSDKAAVKELIPKELRVPTLGIVDNVSDIKFNRDMILKPTHTSGMNVVYRNGDNVIPVRSKLGRALKTKYGADKGEWHYQHITPRILIEPILELQTPSDYKFHMFHGECGIILASRTEGEKKYFGYYDKNWKRLPVKGKQLNDITHPRPRNLQRMLNVAKQLSKGFDYVRVDLIMADKLYFGELTFYPNSGHIAFVPMDFDFKMGELL